MSYIADTPSERDEIEMLLPWYVTGRLDEADRARVEVWLQRDASLAKQLDLIEEERQQAVAASERIRLPANMSAHNTLAQIPDRSGQAARLFQGVTHWIDDLLAALSPSALRWAAAGAVVVILVQSVGLGTLLRQSPSGTSYQTASGRKAPADGVFVLVRPVDTVPLVGLSNLLRTLDASIVGGPSPEGFYRLRIGPASLSPDEVEAKLNRLRQRTDTFQLVLPEPRGN